jgi:hypothetical protein
MAVKELQLSPKNLVGSANHAHAIAGNIQLPHKEFDRRHQGPELSPEGCLFRPEEWVSLVPWVHGPCPDAPTSSPDAAVFRVQARPIGPDPHAIIRDGKVWLIQ